MYRPATGNERASVGRASVRLAGVGRAIVSDGWISDYSVGYKLMKNIAFFLTATAWLSYPMTLRGAHSNSFILAAVTVTPIPAIFRCWFKLMTIDNGQRSLCGSVEGAAIRSREVLTVSGNPCLVTPGGVVFYSFGGKRKGSGVDGHHHLSRCRRGNRQAIFRSRVVVVLAAATTCLGWKCGGTCMIFLAKEQQWRWQSSHGWLQKQRRMKRWSSISGCHNLSRCRRGDER